MKAIRALIGSLSLLVAPTQTTAIAGSDGIKFRVTCELKGYHGDDPDRVQYKREIQLLQDAIARVYARLPKDLKEIALRVTFMINHTSPYTKIFMGWSAEDDPDYRYPDTKFYPEGTIKINVTEKFLRILGFADQIKHTNPSAAEGLQQFADAFLVHELEHAKQYSKKPVRDLASHPDSCSDGLCNKDLIEETKQKVEYEKEAILLGRRFGTKEAWLAAAHAIDKAVGLFPELFSGKGEFRLLAPGAKNSVSKRYLREGAESLSQNYFNESERIIYEGQYVPAEIVWRLKELNDDLELKLQTKSLTLSLLQESTQKIKDLLSMWSRYLDAGQASETLRTSVAYIRAVEKRFREEVARFHVLRASITVD